MRRRKILTQVSASQSAWQRATHRRHAAWVAGAALALLVLAAFWPVVRGTQSFFHFDLYYEHLPIWHATQSALRAGVSPFWLDGEYCGHPLLFQQEAPLFYPPMAPMLLTGVSVHRLNDAFTLVHLWLAGLFAFLLLRGLAANFLAAFFGAAAWMLSARMIQSAIWPSAVAVSAYLPLMLLGIARIGRGERRRGVIEAAVAGGLALLAARPHALLAAAPLLAAVAIGAVARSTRPSRAAADLALAAGLALLLGAPSLVPAAMIYPETSRGAGLTVDERDAQALRPGTDLAQAFLPVDGMPRWPEPAAYAGLAATVLFAAGLALLLLPGRGFARGPFGCLAAGGFVGLAFAFGEKGPYGLVAWIPPMAWFRVPVRYLLSWSLAVAVGSALVLAYWMSRSKRPAWIGAGCVLLLTADLVVHARRAAPTATSEAWRVEPELAAALRQRLGADGLGFPRRFLSLADLLYPVYYRGPELVLMLRRFESLHWANGMRWGLESVWGDGPTLSRTTDLFLASTLRAAALGGVGAVVASAPRPAQSPPSEARPLAIEDFQGLSRAILVPAAIVVPPEKAVATSLAPAFEPRAVAVLETGRPLPGAWESAAGSLTALERGPSRISFSATLPGDGVLVVFNAWEAGWRATVDGEAAPVVRADGAFQGIRLSSGEHRVDLTYRPRGLAEGLGLGIAGVLATVLAALRLKPRSEFAGGAAPGF